MYPRRLETRSEVDTKNKISCSLPCENLCDSTTFDKSINKMYKNINQRIKETKDSISCDINTDKDIIMLRAAHISWIIPIKPSFCFILSPFYVIKSDTFNYQLNDIKIYLYHERGKSFSVV